MEACKEGRIMKYLYNFMTEAAKPLSTNIRIGTYRFGNWYVPISGLVSTVLYSEPNKF